MSARAEFEKWVADHPGDFDLEIQDVSGEWPGQYDDYITQCAWEGFQAGALAMRERAANTAEVCDDMESAARFIRALPVEE